MIPELRKLVTYDEAIFRDGPVPIELVASSATAPRPPPCA